MRTFGKTGVKLTVIAQGGARMDLLPDMEAARKFYTDTLGLEAHQAEDRQ